MVSESMGANDPQNTANLDLRGMVGKIMQGIIKQNIRCRPHGFRGFFSIYSQWTIMTPRVWANFDPRGMVGKIYVGDHWTLLYIKYISCGPELKWHELWAHLLNFLCLWELYVAHGPWQLEFQSSQPKYLMHPFPYHTGMCFTWNLITTWDIYFFENVNRQRQQTINILIILTHLAYRANGNKLWYIGHNNSQLKCVIADATGKWRHLWR